MGNSSMLYIDNDYRNQKKMKRGNKMKVAVTHENGEVFQHFGRTPGFKIYTIENGDIKSEEVLDTGDSGHGALAGFLRDAGADVLICGGIGGGAIAAMGESGIKVYAGASGNADDVIKSYIDGTLPETGEANGNHHYHEGHGDHDCKIQMI